jgi:hypothetical protein
MLQPTGPQAGAEVLNDEPAELLLVLLPIAPNKEIFFSPRWLPQAGQTSSILAVLDRTNFSYLSPQSWQMYS